MSFFKSALGVELPQAENVTAAMAVAAKIVNFFIDI